MQIEEQTVPRFFVGEQEFKTADAAKKHVLVDILCGASGISRTTAAANGSLASQEAIAELILENKDSILAILTDKPKLRKRAKRKTKTVAAGDGKTNANPPSGFQEP